MSIIMTLRMQGDAKALEQHAADNQDAMQAIVGRAKEHGLIAHRFYGSDGGELMVVDEWPDEQSFLTFFEETQEQIAPLMQAAGITARPEPTFWRKLDTRDAVGWDA